MSAKTPTPITILTGFLGAGKTTLLNRVLHAEHGLRVAVLVNDFGAINIDAQLVVGVEGDGDTITLSNGCICCTIRGDLLNACLRLMERPTPPEYILIEASGVSDPAGIAMTFLQTELRPLVHLDSVITVVDAENVLDLDGNQQVLAMDQVAVADLVVINKSDLVTSEKLAAVQAWVTRVSPQARVFTTVQADVPLALLLGVGAFDPQRLAERQARDVHVHAPGEHDHSHDDHSLVFDTWSYTSNEPLVFRAVQRAIDKLPTTIYRAKGILQLDELPEKRAVLQVTGRRVRLSVGEAWGTETPSSQVVLIGQGGTLDSAALQSLFDGCRASHRGKSLNPFSAAVEWLRSAWDVNRLDGLG